VPGAQTPRYIAKISIEDNTITVSEKQDEAAKTTFLVRDIVMRGDVSSRLFAQVRYHGSLVACTLERTGTTATVTFVEPVLVSPGQSYIFYNNDICLGGGIVTT
jgi:tRNA U34 2-thiouridine synthase MnmA/TrmU